MLAEQFGTQCLNGRGIMERNIQLTVCPSSGREMQVARADGGPFVINRRMSFECT